TASPPWPYTTWIAAGSAALAASSTWANIGRPAMGCRTFGKAECMRLPWPAARTTTLRATVSLEFASDNDADDTASAASPLFSASRGRVLATPVGRRAIRRLGAQ